MSEDSTNSTPFQSPLKSIFDGTNFYDPEFTVDISNKMRVPDKISVLPGSEEYQNGHSNQYGDQAGDSKYHWMHVPERILVAGGDRHISGREPLPELKHETSFIEQFTKNDAVLLNTPPHTLTLDVHSFPSAGDQMESQKKSSMKAGTRRLGSMGKKLSNQMDDDYLITSFDESPNQQNSFYNSNMSMSSMDEVQMLRKQIKTLTRRMNALERDNNSRSQKETILLSLSVLYFFAKGLLWVQRHW